VRDATALSQRVKTRRFPIQDSGKAVAMELFMHRQLVIKRENTGVSMHVPARCNSVVCFIAYRFESA
jgi:hypothetical protein